MAKRRIRAGFMVVRVTNERLDTGHATGTVIIVSTEAGLHWLTAGAAVAVRRKLAVDELLDAFAYEADLVVAEAKRRYNGAPPHDIEAAE